MPWITQKKVNVWSIKLMAWSWSRISIIRAFIFRLLGIRWRLNVTVIIRVNASVNRLVTDGGNRTGKWNNKWILRLNVTVNTRVNASVNRIVTHGGNRAGKRKNKWKMSLTNNLNS